MPDSDHCAKCVYWEKVDAKSGKCRCRPPIADYHWPLTRPDDWCGDIILDLDPAA